MASIPPSLGESYVPELASSNGVSCTQIGNEHGTKLVSQFEQQGGAERGAQCEGQKDRVLSLSRRLVGDDPLGFFATNCEIALPDWVVLKKQVRLPSGVRSSDSSIVTAFKLIDGVITEPPSYLLRRLAYLELMQLFAILEALIKNERKDSLFKGRAGRGNATVAIDIYMRAQDRSKGPTRRNCLRAELKERKRIGQAWLCLSRLSPLFALVYSEATEQTIYDFRKLDRRTLSLVAENILRDCPDTLIKLCHHLELQATSATAGQMVSGLNISAISITKAIQGYQTYST